MNFDRVAHVSGIGGGEDGAQTDVSARPGPVPSPRDRRRPRRWRRWVGVVSLLAIVGAVAYWKRPKEEPATREFLQALRVIDVERGIAWQAGELIRSRGREGVTLDFVDATIAATCLRHHLALATYNVKHYPIPELHFARSLS